MDEFARTQRTVIPLPNGEQRELQDECDVNQKRVRCMSSEQWQGVMELYLQNTQEGFRPPRRVNTKKSEKEIKDEELERKLKEAMQQGLMSIDMDSTPRDADS